MSSKAGVWLFKWLIDLVLSKNRLHSLDQSLGNDFHLVLFVNLFQEITAVASRGAQVQFDRVPLEESAKFRKTALSVAKQQNLACCVALLKEVAAHYGFALHIQTGGSAASCHLIASVKARVPQNLQIWQCLNQQGEGGPERFHLSASSSNAHCKALSLHGLYQ